MRSALIILPAIALASSARCQTFYGSTGPIPDDGTTIEFTVDVSGLVPGTIDTTVFGLESVCFYIDHTWLSDLDVYIVAPDGTTALLTGGNGGDTDQYLGTCFNADADTVISNGTPPYASTYKPMQQMGAVNNGQIANGTWKLRILDTYPFADTGALLDWSIGFGPDPGGYIPLVASNLPIVVINTEGMPIANEPKVPATMGIVWNGPGVPNHPTDPFNDFNGAIGIELRGNSSLGFPKKSYGIELWNSDQNDNSLAILDMPAESDWVLRACYSDKSFLNDAITMYLFRRMGHYAPRWRHVDVIIDGQYLGVYLLMEKVKRDPERVDIAKLLPTDVSGDELTGGYLFKIDWAQGSFTGGWTSNYAPLEDSNGQTIDYYYDTPAQPVPQQQQYIQAYVDSFETALATTSLLDTVEGYRRYASTTSFIDMFILNELSRNVDGYRLSTYLHKDKNSNGGKLKIGPPWDYDLAWHNANYYGGDIVSGWAWSYGSNYPGDWKQIPFWWQKFLQDPVFTDSLNCRWDRFSLGFMKVDSLKAWCDSMYTELLPAALRNFQVWPTLGQYVWPNPAPIPTAYNGEIYELKNWISQRWGWINSHLPTMVAGCYHVGVEEEEDTDRSLVFPSPFTDHLTLEMGSIGSLRIEMVDALGRVVHTEVITGKGARRYELTSLGGLPPGLYTVVVQAASTGTSFRVVKE